MSRHPDLYLHNPHIRKRHLLPRWFPSRLIRLITLPGVKFLGYEFGDFPPKAHLAAEFCRSAGLGLIESVRPRIYFGENEIDEAIVKFHLPERYLCIQSSAGSSWAAKNKDWVPERWRQVVGRLEPDHRFVQIGLASEPPIPGIIDLRGKTTLREVACVIAKSDCFVGQEGGMHHMAAAVNTPATLVFSGYIHPSITSYPENVDVYHGADCAPCWLRKPCPHAKKCMSNITVDEVVSAISSTLENPGLTTK